MKDNSKHKVEHKGPISISKSLKVNYIIFLSLSLSVIIFLPLSHSRQS